MVISPWLGLSNPDAIFKKVLFPPPFGPNIP